jgi:hypothetical protein
VDPCFKPFFSSELGFFHVHQSNSVHIQKTGRNSVERHRAVEFLVVLVGDYRGWGGLADKADEKGNTAAACGLSEDDFLLWSQSQDRACRQLVLLLTGGHGLRTLEMATVSVSGPRVGADS